MSGSGTGTRRVIDPAAELRARLLAALAALGFLPACASTVAASDAGGISDDAPRGVDVTGDAPSDASPSTDAPPSCPPRVSPSTLCLTPAASLRAVMFPPGKRPLPDGGLPVPDGGVLPSGCARPSLVTNSCCNAAASLREEGGACCYTFCEQACCGRPLRVDGAPRVAAVTPRDDWRAAATAAPPLADDTRAALANAWREDARLEHASIAAFARFTLELLALGAPPELVADAQRAGLEEVDHARRCFALASRYAGEALGPAPLDLSGLTFAGSPAATLAAVIADGCVGETLSALLAAAQLGVATDPEARDTLAAIADDEARHAALAWRSAAWLLRAHPALRPMARRAFAAALRGPLPRPPRKPAAVPATSWNAHGRLTPPQVDRALDEGVRAVLRPSVAALLGDGPDDATTASPAV